MKGQWGKKAGTKDTCVDFPDPDGPISAVNVPAVNSPDTPFKIVVLIGFLKHPFVVASNHKFSKLIVESSPSLILDTRGEVIPVGGVDIKLA